MEIIDFLKIELKKLANEFPQVEIRYALNTMIDEHIVELTPVKEYYNNEKLDFAWMDIMERYHLNFLGGSLTFISNDSSLAIKEEEIELWYNKPCQVEQVTWNFEEIFNNEWWIETIDFIDENIIEDTIIDSFTEVKIINRNSSSFEIFEVSHPALVLPKCDNSTLKNLSYYALAS